MRPITDDVVIGLMKGLEKREKRVIAERTARETALSAPGSMTSRILKYVAANKGPIPKVSGDKRVASISDAALKRRDTKTSRGLFSYTSGG